MKTIIITFIFFVLLAGCRQGRQKQTATEPNSADLLIYDEVHYENNSEDSDCSDEFIETKETYSFTKLGLACYAGNLEEVKKLINNGACKERCLTDEVFEFDILYTAIKYEHTHIVKYLTGINENVNVIYSEDGLTALSLACSIEDKQKALYISKLLLQAGANENGAGDIGGAYIIYPLFRAIENDNIDLVKLLIENDADLTVKDNVGNSAVDLASNNQQIKSLLLENLSKKNEEASDTYRGYKLGEEFLFKTISDKENLTSNDSIYVSNIRPGENLLVGEVYVNNFKYLDYNDYGDDLKITVIKNNKVYTFVANELSEMIIESSQLTEGDLVEMHWKIDFLTPAGDNEIFWVIKNAEKITKINGN